MTTFGGPIMPEELAEFKERSLQVPWKCMRCGVGGRLRVLSFESYGGVAFMARFPQPDFGRGRLLMYCDECWPEWMAWRARLGDDLHPHGSAVECESQCPLRRDGRRLQFGVLQSVDRKIGFRMVKAIDGQPRVNGSELVMSARVWNYLGGWVARQNYYEAIGTADELRRQMIISNRLPDSREPRVLQDSYILAVEIFKPARTARDGIFRHPNSGEETLGLHAVAIEDYDETTNMFRFWNSWGSGWGDRGYGQMSLEYANDFFYDAIVKRYARWGPIPNKLPRMLQTTDLKEYRRLWSIENPRLIHRIKGPGSRNSRLRRYESISPSSGQPVVCLEITTGFGLRMGWAFIRLGLPSESVSEINELFVWPNFRGMGIGRLLEGQCVEEALRWKTKEIDLIINEADAIVGPPRAAARKFALTLGYEIRWRSRVGPRSPATAIKLI